MKRSLILLFISGLAFALLLAGPRGDVYIEHGLVSDLPPHAEHRDSNLVNPWGLSSNPIGPIWVSDNGTGVVTVYDGDGKPAPADEPIVVTIPSPKGGNSSPTGQVFNNSNGFFLSGANKAFFLFATEEGTILGWNPAVNRTNAVIKVNNSDSGAVYKGLAIGTVGPNNFLYAANFSKGKIDWFNGDFSPVNSPGAFLDVTLPPGYAPFNIRNIGGRLYVTYALQDANKKDDVAGPGNGFVNVFDLSGNFVRRFATRGTLNSPWGLAMASANFGDFSNTLLVGNFGDGRINAFDPASGDFRGQLLEPSGSPLTIEGLWGLLFGNGGQGGDPDVLYFTAGISGSGEVEDHGLFGQIRAQHP